MAEHTYECLFLLDSNKASSNWEGAIGQITGTITRHGGEIILARPWGEPKLAYPIKKFRKGSYLLTYFKSEAKKLSLMEHDFRLNDVILRHMTIKLHPNIATQILAHIRGEAAGAAEPEKEPVAAQ